LYNLIADVIVLLHFSFILFVICGGLLVIRRPQVAFLHFPCVIWGVMVEILGWVCPLTQLENHFRILAGGTSYSGDFIARHLLPVIYPENLTTTIQQVLGGLIILINIIFYTVLIYKYKRGF